MAQQVKIEPPGTVHLIGICGTGMGTLAGLLTARGYVVTGSDIHAYPPMSDVLRRLGISVMQGFRPSNLDHRPDLVVIGNVCRKDNPEAVAANQRGLAIASMPRAICDLFLRSKRPIVITGTHGKTTTTALTAFLLQKAGKDPSFFAGGVVEDFRAGYHLGNGQWFVIEGDEYDSAYFEKTPKFLSYAPDCAVITSVEHDHIDIYPTFDAYKAAFAALIEMVPRSGMLALYAGDAVAAALASNASANVVRYAVQGDPVSIEVEVEAVITGQQTFDLRIGSETSGRWTTPLSGRHNLRNTLAAVALCHLGAGVPLDTLKRALPAFRGVRRRQEIISTGGGVTIYDDFAHHPTAVAETLSALAYQPERRVKGRLMAVFEPRSATACRAIHQAAYVRAFDAADQVIIAPPGRNVPETDRLDTDVLASHIQARGIQATAARSLDDVLTQIRNWVAPGDRVVLLSNGDFGGLATQLKQALS